jgi:hypothetical protein
MIIADFDTEQWLPGTFTVWAMHSTQQEALESSDI